MADRLVLVWVAAQTKEQVAGVVASTPDERTMDGGQTALENATAMCLQY